MGIKEEETGKVTKKGPPKAGTVYTYMGVNVTADSWFEARAKLAILLNLDIDTVKPTERG